ncbi:HAD-IIIC family phosphatase [Amycolatopsis halotolerans]|uniref:HAD-IIIC family phosphatase n=1 Tax=Amycolatopsis halotolerans TaxID=330083 RepID=A0ABV7QEL0_9PSEU
MTASAELVKCLVWDLDETLWRGTLAEGDRPVLPAAVREVVETLDSRGILQSIASRNDHEQAMARLEELGIAEYFVLPSIGWGRKSDAVRAIADELGFAYRTIAFVDDQHTERAEVEFHLPEVRCYAAEDAVRLAGLPEFVPRSRTADSRRRRQLYQAGFRRAAERAAFAGPDEGFLRSLDLRLDVRRASGDDLARVEELTLRTSQMNATGVHYDAAALGELTRDSGHEVLTAALTDRIGPHGAVGIVLLETGVSNWRLKLLATSCRAVPFGVGSVLLGWLADQAALAGVHLSADFRPTGRNRMMEVAYRFAGFAEQECSCLPGRGGSGPDEEVQRLHLIPDRQAPPATMRLSVPDLAGPRLSRSSSGPE